MTVLHDTHLWLWWLLGSPQLTTGQRRPSRSPDRGNPLAHALPMATFDSSIRRSQVVPLWPVG